MKISEVFKSLQGEGPRAGLPTVFVRLQDCNLYPNCCSYCDTKYAQSSNGRTMLVVGVVDEVERLSKGCRAVCLSGGEPMYQLDAFHDLVDRLKFHDYFIEVFTNGTISPSSRLGGVDSWVVDIKCPSSGVSEKCLVSEWLSVTREVDAVKFVVADVGDLDYALSSLRDFDTRAQVLVSPIVPNCPNSQFGEVLMSRRAWLQTVWEFCAENGYRFSFQTHKLVFGNRRGV